MKAVVSARILKIIEYLYQYKKSTYKEIEQALEIKERYIRYDIDRINEILVSNNLEPIIRKSKGILELPINFKIELFETDHEFLYSQEERSSLLLLLLLFDNRRLRLSQVSKDLQVSRSTIKNDMAYLENILLKDNISIYYNGYFYLDGDSKICAKLMNDKLKQYISLIKHQDNLNSFQRYVIDIFNHAFYNVSLPRIIILIDCMLEDMECVLTDNSYNWYVANILSIIWFITNDIKPPLELNFLNKFNVRFNSFISGLEELLGKKITEEQSSVIIRLLNYTSKHIGFDDDVDLITIESIILNLVSKMSVEMEIHFQNDAILIEGLFNHIDPLIKRIKAGVAVSENVISLLTAKNMEIYDIVARVILDIEILKEITSESEIAYLAIHFIASVRRLDTRVIKRILLVCGYGYGTTTMLKEALLNDYQVDIVDTIPEYKVVTYPNFNQVDMVITTMKLNVNIKYLQVHPILTQQDHQHLINAGISRRKTLSNYYSLNNRLEFLTDEDRLKVLQVIRQEMGYQNQELPRSINKLSDMLNIQEIVVCDKKMTWQEAVIQSCNILEINGSVDDEYKNSIFSMLKESGNYSVMDGSFALLHGSSDEHVYQTSMSLIINKQDVYFDKKKINIIFCLSSKDQKEHIPAIISLMKLEKTTDIIKQLVNANTNEEVYKMIVDYEKGAL